jgi:hypothetical protein
MGHIAYEVEMCVDAAVRCVLAAGPGGDDTARNAFLESALLHARCVFEFLDAKKRDRRDDDMIREDFGPPWKPAKGKEQEARTALHKVKPDIDKHLAHLTWQRVDDPETPSWTVLQVAQDVTTLARAWATHLTKAVEGDPMRSPIQLTSALDKAERALADAAARAAGLTGTVSTSTTTIYSTETGSGDARPWLNSTAP